MLSSTSLLHGNCIFNRNNTVATQQGLKTYWLCKSYRLTMCRARCITHQGRVISATGLHNHEPHMRSPAACDYGQSAATASSTSQSNGLNASAATRFANMPAIAPTAATNQTPLPSQQHASDMGRHHDDSHAGGVHTQRLQCAADGQATATVAGMQQHSSDQATTETASNAMHLLAHHHNPLQNMMHTALSHNSLINLTNITPILDPLQDHTSQSHGSGELHVIGGHEGDDSGSMHSPDAQHTSMVRHHMSGGQDLHRIVHATEHIHAAHHQSTEMARQNAPDMHGSSGGEPQSVVAHHQMQADSFKVEQI